MDQLHDWSKRALGFNRYTNRIYVRILLLLSELEYFEKEHPIYARKALMGFGLLVLGNQ